MMDSQQISNRAPFQVVLAALLLVQAVHCAVHDLTATDDRPTLYRKVRDDRYFLNRYGGTSGQPPAGAAGLPDHRRGLKPDANSPEARDGASGGGSGGGVDGAAGTGIEKRCIRCTGGYVDPYDYRDYDRDRHYYDRYDDRRGYDDRNDYRSGGYDRDRYDTRYDHRYDNRYDNRYDSRTYYDRDRWYERRPEYDRGGYDRYDSRGSADRYDRYDGRGAAYDSRGYGYDNRGYDNRGYDYRKAYDTRGFRPWDETTRGSSGWDSAGRGYYFATGRPEPSGNWGYDRGYASTYNYGGGRAESWRDPYASRPRDPYAYDGYRGTSYLYERNAGPNSTPRPPPAQVNGGEAHANGGNAGVTDRPDSNPNKSTDTSASG